MLGVQLLDLPGGQPDARLDVLLHARRFGEMALNLEPCDFYHEIFRESLRAFLPERRRRCRLFATTSRGRNELPKRHKRYLYRRIVHGIFYFVADIIIIVVNVGPDESLSFHIVYK